MLNQLSQLIRPFAFLTIKHPSRLPFYVNWVIPTSMSLLVIMVALACGIQVNVFGGSGVVDKMLGFLQSLPGFYIAALAAIATFQNPDMSKLMPGDPPKMSIVYNGKPAEIQLTRRRFLSAMFSYLTALSIVMTLCSVALLSLELDKIVFSNFICYELMKLVVCFVYLAAVAQLFLITFWGLFYLGERVHTPD